ncbi:hypothetical protein OsJ_23073 [Oryza sativa Japonica Group]|uniref:SKP1 component dimerisation domain-containing protein n=1 Tax=Oryza sativa subsp. japonica TaxID=39947 RepID=B9FVG9_ORYSJ|nr:hypothetical protein OsJ_23073 [Oryza sativa Japonica Group]
MAADKKEVADDTILLISSDGEHFNPPRSSPRSSNTCVKHAAAAEDEEKELKSFDAEFMIDVDKNMLYGLLLASNFLNIKSLLDLCCQHTANLIKGK